VLEVGFKGLSEFLGECAAADLIGMGSTHFLIKTLPRVAPEMALLVLAYNLTRLMNIIGIQLGGYPGMAGSVHPAKTGQSDLLRNVFTHQDPTRTPGLKNRQGFHAGLRSSTLGKHLGQ
jgi:hypothetical protein